MLWPPSAAGLLRQHGHRIRLFFLIFCSAWLSDLGRWCHGRRLGQAGTPVDTPRLSALCTWLPPGLRANAMASEVCGSGSQVQGWPESELTAQPSHGSIGYSVDTLWFHDEVTLFSSDGDFSECCEWTSPKQSFRRVNRNENLVPLWEETGLCYQGCELWSRTNRVSIPGSDTCWLNSGKLLHTFEPQFPHLWTGIIIPALWVELHD